MREEKLEKIKELELLIKTNERIIFELEKSRNFQSVYEGFLSEILSDDLIIESPVDGRNIQFKMYDKSINRHREVFSIYFPWSWGEEDEKSEFELSYYTTNTGSNNSFEFSRLIMLGKVAEFIGEDINKEGLMKLYRVTKSLHKDEIQILNSERRKLGKEKTTLHQEVKDIDKQIKLDNLSSSGIAYLQGKWIDVKHGVTLRNIVFIQLLSYTTSSKKTATFKFKDGSGYEMVYDRVKVPNIINQI